MTTTFQESLTNDLILDGDGRLLIVTDARAVASDARSAMQAQRGEMVLAMAEGMPTLEVAWSGYRSGQFEAAARAVLLRVPGVRTVETLTTSREGEVLRYDATISTDFGPVTLRV